MSTLLHVEDDPGATLLTRRAFERAAFDGTLVQVPSGDEAVAWLRSGNPARLVLLDLKMPGRDGIDVLTWIRLRSSDQGLPVVVLSSSELATDIEHARGLGPRAYLVKPMSFRELQPLAVAIATYFELLTLDREAPFPWLVNAMRAF